MAMQYPTIDPTPQQCQICLHTGVPVETQRVRCNVRRFRDRSFNVWRCARCRSLHCETISNISEYYEDYPIRNQELDYFVRAWYQIILKRMVKAGLRKENYILDYGCNNGLFIRFLMENNYHNCFGYDPYVEQFKSRNALEAKYDFVVSLDVIEHDQNPREFLAQLSKMLKPGGRLCLETPNAEGIDMSDTEEYMHALHMPYHVHILSQRALTDLSAQQRLELVATYSRWYMDSWLPGTARRLFESLMKFGDNDIDSGYETPRLDLFFRHPVLFFYLFFGYFIPSHKKDHVMMILTAKS